MFSPSDVDRFAGDKSLRERRRQAAERAIARGLPSFTEEVWRYSQIDDLDLERYELAVPGAVSQAASDGAERTPLTGGITDDIAAAAVVSVVDGVIAGIEVRDAAVSVRTLDSGAGELLGSVMEEAVDFFAEANLAFTSAPVVIEIAADATLSGPVLVSAHTSQDNTMWFPRLVVVAGESSEAVVVEQHTSADIGCLVCPITELRVKDQAQLSHVTVQQMGSSAWQIASVLSVLETSARLDSYHVALGGGYARARIDTQLVGEHSHSDLSAVYFGSGEVALDFRTFQRHVAPNTSSDLLFKGALDDYSRAVYTGLIRIEPDASGTEALQTNRNLKLSPNAWAESVPNLEIENNDVKCSHASATGPVDPDQRFYLERLGVPSDAAELLVVQGFFDEVLETLPVKQIGVTAGEHIAELLAGRLD